MKNFKPGITNKSFFYQIQSALKASTPAHVGHGTVNWAAIAAAIAQGPAAGPALPVPRDQDVIMKSPAPAAASGPVAGPSTIPAEPSAPVAQTTLETLPNAPAAPGKTHAAHQAPVKSVAPQAAPAQPLATTAMAAPVPQPAAKKRKRTKKDEELTADETEARVPLPGRAKPSAKKRTTKDNEGPSQSKKYKSAETVDTDDDEDDAGEEHEGEQGEDGEDAAVPSDNDPPEDIQQVWRIRAYHAKHDVVYKAYGTSGEARCNHCKLKALEHCWTVPGLKCQACRLSKIRCDRRTTGQKHVGEKVKKVPKSGTADEPKGMCTHSASISNSHL